MSNSNFQLDTSIREVLVTVTPPEGVHYMKVKTHPAIALFVGSLYMGIACNLDLNATISTIASGFGEMMTSLGYSIAFGVMLGHILSRIGAVKVIADSVVRLFSRDRAEYGMGLTGFIVSIPVFYDVGFVILAPLARALAKNFKAVSYYVAALTVGLGITHGMVPPTPGPMTAAELVGADLGSMILFGILVGLPTAIIAITLYNKFFLERRGFWNSETDEDPNFVLAEKKDEDIIVEREPTLAFALLPIILPIILVLMGTVANAIDVSDNELLTFISNNHIALFIGLLSTIGVALACGLKKGTLEKELSISVEAIGTILFITGAGGSLGEILKLSQVGDVLVDMVSDISLSPLLFTWFIAWLIKLAQGSSTVGIVTACGLVAPMLTSFSVNPALIALAASSGCLGACHVNDSGFWVAANIAGFTTKGGLKTYTILCFLCSIVSLIIILILNLFV